MDLINKFTIEGEEFDNLQKELAEFYNADIPFFNPFDEHSRRDNIPVIVPRVDVSHGDMTVNIIEKFDLKVFPKIIMRNIKALTGSDNFDIVNCWGTDMKKGSEGLLHHHLPTEISGVYYHAIDPDDSKIEYMIDGKLVQFESKLGTMFIWPAHVLHRIPLKTSDSKRRSVSFNLMYKG